ncbi:MAG TPA: hypothetical protein PKN52_00175 [Trueperaceae bacterium]|nr:hypothetical protein [Trueperaceae bacterium]
MSGRKTELGELTRGERLLIDRRRRGEGQIAAARRLGLTHSMYGKMERDAVDWGMPVEIGELAAHERCLLYRRRAGFTQARVAEELEVCRFWVNQMEQGLVGCDTLLWYWEQ